MARFRGTIHGQRGEASRLGTASSGLTVKANGWDLSGTVSMFGPTDSDSVQLTLTTGSNGSDSPTSLGAWKRGDSPTGFVPADKRAELIHAAIMRSDNHGTGYAPKTGRPCNCTPGVVRDNCSACEGSGYRIDFSLIRHGGTR